MSDAADDAHKSAVTQNLAFIVNKVKQLELNLTKTATKDMAISLKGTVSPPKFSGKPDEDVHEFLKLFIEYGNANFMDKNHLIRILPTTLSGLAKAKYDSADAATKLDYDKIQCILLKEFLISPAIKNQARAALHHAKKRSNESVFEYADRVKSMVRKTYPELTDFGRRVAAEAVPGAVVLASQKFDDDPALDSICIDSFLSGLPTGLQKPVRRKNCKSLESAVTEAENEETMQNIEKEATDSTDAAAAMASIRSLEQKIEQLEANRQSAVNYSQYIPPTPANVRNMRAFSEATKTPNPFNRDRNSRERSSERYERQNGYGRMAKNDRGGRNNSYDRNGTKQYDNRGRDNRNTQQNRVRFAYPLQQDTYRKTFQPRFQPSDQRYNSQRYNQQQPQPRPYSPFRRNEQGNPQFSQQRPPSLVQPSCNGRCAAPSNSQPRCNFVHASDAIGTNTAAHQCCNNQQQHAIPPTLSSSSSHSHSSPSLSPWTLLPMVFCIIACIIPGTVGQVTEQYQICGHGKQGFLLETPVMNHCEPPQSHRSQLFAITDLYAPRDISIRAQTALCYNIKGEVCTSSFLHLTMKVDSDTESIEKTSMEECWQAFNTHSIASGDLIPRGARAWSANTTDTGYSFPILGSKCHSSSIFVLEEGSVVSFDGDNMVSDLTDVGGCRLLSGMCQTTHGTLVWNTTGITMPCSYKKMGSYVAQISPPHVLIESLQLGLLLDRNLTMKSPCAGMIHTLNRLSNGFLASFPAIITQLPIAKWMDANPDELRMKLHEVAEQLIAKNDYLSYERKLAMTKSPLTAIPTESDSNLLMPEASDITTPQPPQFLTPLPLIGLPPRGYVEPTMSIQHTGQTNPSFRLPFPTATVTTTARSAGIPLLTTPIYRTPSTPSHDMSSVQSHMSITTAQPAHTPVVLMQPAPERDRERSEVHSVSSGEPSLFQASGKSISSSRTATSAKGGTRRRYHVKASELNKSLSGPRRDKRYTTEEEALIGKHLEANILANTPAMDNNDPADNKWKALTGKIQFLSDNVEVQMYTHLSETWAHLCELQNTDRAITIALIQNDPTTGCRALLRRSDIVAEFRGDVLAVYLCTQVNVSQVYRGNQIGDKCYASTPVDLNGKIFFIQPGTRDLTTQGLEIPCSSRRYPVFRDSNSMFRTMNGPIHVQQFPQAENGKPVETDILFDAPPLFHGESVRINTLLELMQHRINRDKTSFVPTASDPDAFGIDLDDPIATGLKLGESLGKGIKDLTDYFGEGIRKEMDEWQTTARIIAIAILLLATPVAIGALYFYFPWVFQICKKGGKTRTPGRVRFNAATEEVKMEDLGRLNRTHDTTSPVDTGRAHSPTTAPSSPRARSPTPVPPPRRTSMPKLLTMFGVVSMCVNNVTATSSGTLPKIGVHVNNTPLIALIDSGSNISFVSKSIAKKIGISVWNRPSFARATNGTSIQFLGEFEAVVLVGKTLVNMNIRVTNDGDCPAEILLGTDWMKSLPCKVILDFHLNQLKIGSSTIDFLTSEEEEAVHSVSPASMEIHAVKEFQLPPNSDNIILGALSFPLPPDWELLIEGLSQENGLVIGKTLVVSDSDSFPIRVLNTSPALLTIHKGEVIATAENVGYVDEQNKYVLVYEMPDYDRSQAHELRCNFTQPVEKDNEPLDPHYVPPEAQLDIPSFIPEPDKPFHIEKEVDLDSCILNPVEKRQLLQILNKHIAAFSTPDAELGRYNGPITHSIDLIPNATIRPRPPYRLPLEHREEIRKQVDAMLKSGIIYKCTSAFSAPIVLVKKKDGTKRFTVDYRSLNSITRPMTHVLPHIQETIDRASGHAIYSVCDMAQGFFQIPIKKEDRHKTSFSCFAGQFCMNVVPMGISASPVFFQNVLESVLRDCKGKIMVFIDDIIICSMTPQQHLLDIEEVLTRLEQANLKLKAKKCHFARAEIKYLGLLLSLRGSRPDPEKTAAINLIKAPTNPKQTKQVLGAFGYFRRYIKGYSTIAHPLTELTKTTVPFKWSPEAETAFAKLKLALLSDPILRAPRLNHPYFITTDASLVGIGGCLSQKDDEDKEYAVAYASRCLNKHEVRYPPVELEALGIVFCLDKFYPYVAGSNSITILSDHAPLRSLMYRTDLTGRLCKYQLKIQGFNASIQYKPGKWNTLADCLSRAPLDSVNAVAISSSLPDILPSISEIEREQRDNLSSTWQALTAGLVPRAPYSLAFAIGDALYTPGDEGPRLIIPTETLQRRVVSYFHSAPFEGGHQGTRRTSQRIENKYFWPHMRRSISRIVRTCDVCQRIKFPPQWKTRSHMGNTILSTRPFETVHADILGALPLSITGHRYALIVVCAYSKWVILEPLFDMKAETVALAFLQRVVYIHGSPERIVSDSGTQFLSDLFQQVVTIIQSTHRSSSPHHQQANGQCERYVKVVLDALRAYTSTIPEDWPNHLGSIALSMNTAVNRVTQETPCFLVFGRDLRVPSDDKIPLPRYADPDFRSQLITSLEVAREAAGQAIKANFDVMKAQHDQATKSADHKFRISDLVMLDDPNPKGKLDLKFTGPYRIIRLDDPNAIIQTVGKAKQSDQTVHMNRLKPYFTLPSLTGSNSSSSIPTPANHTLSSTLPPSSITQPSLPSLSGGTVPLRRSPRLNH